MIPEIGNFSLAMAFAVGLVLGIMPLWGNYTNNKTWSSLAFNATWVQFILLTVAMFCLGYSFYTDDFSVKYVAENSNTELPLMYKISAIWGGHEGSLLFWVYVLSLWMVMVTIFSRSLPYELRTKALSILGLLTVGFLSFLIFTSNPFEILLNVPSEGRDLNPLLQDPGLAIHPPMLYIGYVGFSVPFAFSIAALLDGKLDATWARWSRPWTVASWLFLTFGISLGSYWAYYELGWGGWWFWDPVENASFMPWLMGTALIHTLAVAEKRGSFKSWALLLSIFTFSFSLLGTFLVRSGVLVSVHAFSTDPERGIFILSFLSVVVLASLALYAFRIHKIHEGGQSSPVSKETFLLLNNILLVVASLTVLIGTLYPLFSDYLYQSKISVGPPYFNMVFVPIMLPLIFLMGFGVLSRWKKDNLSRILSLQFLVLPISMLLGAITPYLIFGHTTWGVSLAIAIAFWVIAVSLFDPFLSGNSSFKDKLKSIKLNRYGMISAHVGIGVFVIGATFASHYSIEKDVRMDLKNSTIVSDYKFEMLSLSAVKGENYTSTVANIRVTDLTTLEEVSILQPEKRKYNASTMPMTEAAIDGSLTRDLYLAMGDAINEDGTAWAMRVYYKPFIRWIWLGTLFMILGGLLVVFDKRYRHLAKRAMIIKDSS